MKRDQDRAQPQVRRSSGAVHVTFAVWMKSSFPDGTVSIVDDEILAGDVDAGDVIVLPEADDAVLVKRVRLGQGGFLFTIVPVGDDRPEAERVVTLTTEVRLRKRGRNLAG